MKFYQVLRVNFAYYHSKQNHMYSDVYHLWIVSDFMQGCDKKYINVQSSQQLHNDKTYFIADTKHTLQPQN